MEIGDDIRQHDSKMWMCVRVSVSVYECIAFRLCNKVTEVAAFTHSRYSHSSTAKEEPPFHSGPETETESVL